VKEIHQLSDSVFITRIRQSPSNLDDVRNLDRAHNNPFIKKQLLTYIWDEKLVSYFEPQDFTQEIQDIIYKKGVYQYAKFFKMCVQQTTPNKIDVDYNIFLKHINRNAAQSYEKLTANEFDRLPYKFKLALLRNYDYITNFFMMAGSGSKSKSVKFWYIIIKQTPYWYIHCPSEYKQILAEHAVFYDGYNMHYVPQLTHKICRTAVSKSGLNLRFIPKEFKTLELCELALEKAISALRYVPTEYQTGHMLFNCLLKNPKALNYSKKRKKYT